MQNRRPLLKKLSYTVCEKKLIEGAAAIQYTSELERQEAEELGFKSRPVIIGNPVAIPDLASIDDSAFRRRYPALAGKTVFLFLSRIDKKKGLDLLIQAFAALRAGCPNSMLVIAGDGPRELVDSYKRSAQAAGLENLIWAGFLDAFLTRQCRVQRPVRQGWSSARSNCAARQWLRCD